MSTTHTRTQTISLDRHEDDEWYDEVAISCEERWKESEMSGDEWRFTYVAEFKRKGHVQKRLSSHKLEWLLPKIAAHQDFAPCGDDDDAKRDFDEFCAQPGCCELATLEYEKKLDWCHRCGKSHEVTWASKRRRFCEHHKRRGDCGLDDADANYTLARVLRDGEWQPAS